MPFRNRAAFLLLATLSVLHTACSSTTSQSPSVSVTPTPITALPDELEKATTPTKSTPSAQDIYERAIDVAYSAELLSESAVSADDWQLSLSRWQEAIALLRKIPTNSPLYAMAKPKIAEYQRSLNLAKQQPPRPRPQAPTGIIISTAPATPEPQAQSQAPTAPKTKSANQQIHTIPIKRRSGKTPIVDVTFNGGQVFEMVLDTGASGTVITQAMAQSLGVTPEGEVTADTASEQDVKFPVTTVDSISVGGAVAKNVPVAIGSDNLEVGLLGQDFFSKYDVVIRQNVVEFHQR